MMDPTACSRFFGKCGKNANRTAPSHLSYPLLSTSYMLIGQTVIWSCFSQVEGQKKHDNQTKNTVDVRTLFSLGIGDMEVFLAPDDGKNTEAACKVKKSVRQAPGSRGTASEGSPW